MYDHYGVDLEALPLVGVGSICRRNADTDIAAVLRPLWPTLALHAFGLRGSSLKAHADHLASADSMAWSYQGRRMHRLPGCTHRGKSEANCLRWALMWRDDRLHDINQLRLEENLCVV
jgi:hypothetical protein